MNKILKTLLPTLALTMLSTASFAGTWYHPETASDQVAQAQAQQQVAKSGERPAAGPVDCHMIWAAADKGKCMNEFPLAQGGRASDTPAVAVVPASR